MEFFVGFIIGAIFSGLMFGFICYRVGRTGGFESANNFIDEIYKKEAI